MKKYVSIILLACMSCGSEAQQVTITDNIVEKISQTLQQKYVDPSVAKKITDQLLENQKNGKYDSLKNQALLSTINQDIHAIHNDRHIQVVDIQNSKKLPWSKPFIESTKILEANIGYLKLSYFPNPNDEVYNKIAEALSLLAATDGIIIDLRNNGGGHPDIASNILGHFLEGSVLYEQFHVPFENKTYKYFSHKKVKGTKLIDKPLRIIVNKKTSSSAELLAFAIQNLKIGKLYGSTTRGLVNLAEYYPINDTIYLLASKGKQQNPFSDEGIEQNGVVPDFPTDEYKSLSEAHLSLIEQVHGRQLRDWVSQKIQAEKYIPDVAILDKLVGKYQNIVISKDDVSLVYEDPTGFDYKLQALSDSYFRLEEIYDDRFRLIFKKEENQMILIKQYFDGSMVSMPKDRL